MISIIIVNYNGQRFLKRLFDSIYKQSYKKFEVILVDNESKDNSIEFVKKTFKKVRVFSKKNQGFGSACNFGAKKAKGNYLAFLNEDMYLPKDFLEIILTNYLNKEKKKIKIGGMSCKLIDFDSNPQNMPKKYGGQIDIFGFPNDRYDPNDIFTISGCPFFIAKKTYVAVKGFNENIFLYGEDLDLSWRLKIFGYQNFMIHDTYIFHYGGGTTGGFGVEKIINNLFISFISIITNYNDLTLIFVFPVYILYISFLVFITFIIKDFNIDYLIKFTNKLYSFLTIYKKIRKFRTFVQKNRKLNDLYLKKFISPIPSIFLNKPYQKLSKNYIIKN